jgi:hypothetical protein
MTEEEANELLEALMDMVGQHCDERDEGGRLSSACISANAFALRTLAKHGKVKIIHEYGRGVVAEWVQEEAK